MRARRDLILTMLLLCAPLAAQAQGAARCDSDLMAATPVRTGMLAPVALELAPASTRLGNSGGVLAQAFDEALSVDNVLMRIRQEGCRAIASARAVNALDPNDPAAYKPKTEFDNTPWRFNMTQNGKRMTADEFDAWMKSKGVRVVGRQDAAPAAAAPEASTPSN